MTKCQALDTDKKRAWFDFEATSPDGCKIIAPNGEVFLAIRSQILSALKASTVEPFIGSNVFSLALDAIREEATDISTHEGQVALARKISDLYMMLMASDQFSGEELELIEISVSGYAAFHDATPIDKRIWSRLKDRVGMVRAQKQTPLHLDGNGLRETIDAMHQYGGAFVSGLADLLQRADRSDTIRILQAFPNYIRQYHKMYQDKKGK